MTHFLDRADNKKADLLGTIKSLKHRANLTPICQPLSILTLILTPIDINAPEYSHNFDSHLRPKHESARHTVTCLNALVMNFLNSGNELMDTFVECRFCKVSLQFFEVHSKNIINKSK
jgi:hypothetical protein